MPRKYVKQEIKTELKPLWIYDPKDRTTWKFTDTVVTEVEGKRIYKGSLLNPVFKYSHLEKPRNRAQLSKYFMPCHDCKDIKSECDLCRVRAQGNVC